MPAPRAARALGDVIVCKRPANALIERNGGGALTGRALDGALAMPERAPPSGPYILSPSSYDSSLWQVANFHCWSDVRRWTDNWS